MAGSETQVKRKFPDIAGRDVLDEAAFVDDPYGLYARLREEREVHPVQLPDGLRVWLVARYADARAALADNRLKKRRTGDLMAANGLDEAAGVARGDILFTHMLNTDPPDHERLRRLVNTGFSARRIEQLRPRIEEITADLLDAMGDGGESVDLLDAFAFPIPITVICELLGVPVADRDDFRIWTDLLISGFGTDEERQRAGLSMNSYLLQLIEDKRTAPGPDLISSLISMHEEGDSLSREEVVAMAFLLLVAGHETTVNLIANGVLALITHPDQLAALRADRSLLRGAVEEFLRYESPVKNATLRYTDEPTDIGGTVIPAGQFVVVALGGANRDPHRYAEPDHLDITRDTTGHLAFGHGIHFCLGAPLARLEGEIAIGGLLDRFARIDLAVDPAELRWRGGLLIRGPKRMPVRLGR